MIRAEVLVYRYHEAPEELRALSDHGGDEEDVVVGLTRSRVEAVAERLDRWGSAEYHETTWHGQPVVVAITAHA